ncbi:MAG: type II toxin-antitoxin system mRNA interferase toxin, RelE/StbE family [Patescibacteria group bacterium]
MKIFLHRNFKKRYKNLNLNEKEKFEHRRNLFLQNPFDQILNNHSLGGNYKGYRSINITGDLRVIYEPLDKETVLFIKIDTHSNLYK